MSNLESKIKSLALVQEDSLVVDVQPLFVRVTDPSGSPQVLVLRSHDSDANKYPPYSMVVSNEYIVKLRRDEGDVVVTPCECDSVTHAEYNYKVHHSVNDIFSYDYVELAYEIAKLIEIEEQ